LVLPADVVMRAARCSGRFPRASSVNVDDDVKTTAPIAVGQMAARKVGEPADSACLFRLIGMQAKRHPVPSLRCRFPHVRQSAIRIADARA
jgi:hypothetical protein